MIDVFEIPNTFTPDLSLDVQIELGICDWQAEDEHGHVAFGHTREEAIFNLKRAGV